MKFTLVALQIFIVSLCFGQLGSFPVGDGVTLYLSDILLVGLFLTWLFESLLIRRRLFLALSGWPLLAFNALALVTLISSWRYFSSAEVTVGFLYLLRWVAYSSLYFVGVDLVKKNVPVAAVVVKTLIFSGIILAVAGFIQLLVLPDFRYFAVEYGWDPHRGRLLSTFFDPNFAAAYLVVIVTLVMARTIQGRLKALALAILVVIITALLLTFSRSGWLMLGTVILVFGVLRARSLLVIAVVVAFAAYLFVPRVQTRLSGVTDPADSAHFRLLSWQKTLQIANDYPLTGVGFNNFRYAQASYGFFDYAAPTGGHAGAGSDSSWLLVLATTGYLGFFLFVLTYLKLAIKGWQRRRTVEGLALLAIIAGLAVEANFINSLFYTPITAAFWILAGTLDS